MFKKITASLCVAAVAGLGLTACEPPKKGSKAEKTATSLKMKCQPPKAYVVAGEAAKAGKGQFYVCRTSNTENCKIQIHYKGDVIKWHNQVMRQQGFTTIPKNAESWRTDNCKIFKNDRKGATE